MARWLWRYGISLSSAFGVYFWRDDRPQIGVPLVALAIAMVIDGGPRRRRSARTDP